jgi:hypothetical protein
MKKETMKEVREITIDLMRGFLLAASASLGQKDYKGYKDRPLFSRMPNYYIADCRTSPFGSFEFNDSDSQGKKNDHRRVKLVKQQDAKNKQGGRILRR